MSKTNMTKTVILHGWAYETSKWNPFLDLLAKKLKYDFPTIPGLTEDLEEVWSLDDYVEWLKKKVGGNKVNLIGHSNGGRIALAFAIKYPDQVEKLVLLDAAGIRSRRLRDRLKRFIFRTVATLGKKILPINSLRFLLHKLAREKDYYEASPQLRKTMQNLIEIDLGDELQKVEADTLIIWGENDKATPLSDGKMMNQEIKSSALVVVKNARHSPMFTHSKIVANHILEFLCG